MHIAKTVIYPQIYHQIQNIQKKSDIDQRSSHSFISPQQIESVDLFIDLLVEGQETILDTSSGEILQF